MSILRLLPAWLSLLLLAALSLRLGLPLMAAVILLLLLMAALWVRRTAVRTAMSAILGTASLAWGAVNWFRVQERLAFGRPWIRLAVILAAVALFNLWAAWLLWRYRALDTGRAA